VYKRQSKSEANEMSSILSDHLSEQARWRETKAERYPEDERNARSAEALNSLASYVDSEELVNGTAVWFLGILEYDGRMNFGEKAARLIGRYGFDREVTGSAQHDKFLADLQQIAAGDTYKFAASEIGGWPAGVSMPAECFKADRRGPDAKLKLLSVQPSAPSQVQEGQGVSGFRLGHDQPARRRQVETAASATTPCPAGWSTEGRINGQPLVGAR
jgi:hypothetical protein